MSDVALAVGGATDRCRLCGDPVGGIDAAGAVGLDGVVCPGCAENIVHYTPRCGYVGRPGGGVFALYRYHGHPSGAGGVVFLEPSDAAVASPRELTAYYRDLPRRVRRVVWWFAADAVPLPCVALLRTSVYTTSARWTSSIAASARLPSPPSYLQPAARQY
jgi:hypothetical protein